MKRSRVFGVEFSEGIERTSQTRMRRALDRSHADMKHWVWKPYDPVMLANLYRRSHRLMADFVAETNYQPRKTRQKVVLCLYGWPKMLLALRRSGLKYCAFSCDQWARGGTIDVKIGKTVSAEMALGGVRLNLADVQAVVWQPPSWMVFSEKKDPCAIGPEIDQHLLVRRWSQVLRDLRGLVAPGAIWLPSHPLNGSQEWQNRVSEFGLALRSGLNVPRAICTNDPETAAAFIDQCGGRALFREFGIQPFCGPLEFVTSADVRGCAERLRLSPCSFIEYIEKDYDVRAVVVGDKVFAVRIDSQASPSERARVDWRASDNAHVRWERMKLPKALEAAMLRLMRRLDLRWGSFDFAKGRDGVFYFLEVNRPGSTEWLEPLVGLNVSREIVGYLQRVL